MIFDFGWTLAEFVGDGGWPAVLQSALVELETALEESSAAKTASAYEMDLLGRLREIPPERADHLDDLWAQMGREWGPEQEAPRSRAVEIFGSRLTIDWKLYRETIPFLDVLSRRGYRMALISNVCSPPRHWRLLVERLGLTHYLPVTVFSSEVGHSKPDAEPFEEALDALGADPAEAMYVGDTPRRDVDGAARAGITPVHLRRRPEAPMGDHAAAITVSTLKELLPYLPPR